MLLALAGLLVGLAGPARAQTGVADAATDGGGQVLVLLRLPPPHLRPGADYGGGYGDGASRGARRRIAARLARANGLALVEDWPMPLLGVDCFVMAVPAGRSPVAVAAALGALAGVEWSQPMNAFVGKAGIADPNDPLFRAQPAATQWHLASLHQVADGQGVRVAVIDSQVERGHPDLAGQVETAVDFGREPSAGEAHGTAVAGIIAAHAGNGLGIAGIAPRARLLALRACRQRRDGATLCDSLSLAKAIHDAVQRGARIINLSLGGPADALLGRLIDVALARGVTVVAAFDRAAPGGGFPASHPGVVAVADSGMGPVPAGVWEAPGQGVPTAAVGGGWHLVNGSSYAAAHVSGLFALLRGQLPRARGRPRLIAGGDQVGGAAGGDIGGRGGIVDSCATLQHGRGGGPLPCPTAAQISAGLRD